MPNKILLFLLLLTLELFSITLKDTYYINSNNIKLLDIVPDAKYDVTLYENDKGRYTKRIRTKDIIQTLKKHDFTKVQSSSNYIRFIKKSPIDTSKIEEKVRQTYLKYYPNISIHSILVMPRGYVKSMSDNYVISLQKRSHLSHKGTLSIKTQENKKIFFDYFIEADIKVYLSKESMSKGDAISTLSTIKQNIPLDKLRALPINIQQINTTQTKHHIKANFILTMRDIELLHLIKKGASVNVNLDNSNISISFLAKAVQNGKLNDIITVQKRDGKKIKVKVIGKNRVEMR